jgi:hypothetical protein
MKTTYDPPPSPRGFLARIADTAAALLFALLAAILLRSRR